MRAAEVGRWEKKEERPGGSSEYRRYRLLSAGRVEMRYDFKRAGSLDWTRGRWTKAVLNGVGAEALNLLDVAQVSDYFARKGYERTR